MSKTWNELLKEIGSTQDQVDNACSLNNDLNYNLSRFVKDFDDLFLSKPEKKKPIQDAVKIEDLFNGK
tara:strand:+ start:185 stop:388 length:204 start_codon:yes stop_codon:yes gene_type:complete